MVCHKCDTPLCVRPDHLFLGTAQDNVDDCKAKGRLLTGLRHQNAKLTDEQVAEIKSTPFRRGIVTSFAKRFDISKGHVSDIRNGNRRVA